MEQSTGMLSLCATPIGNLGDITLRVMRAFEQADQVWAEDTRHTLRLLNHLEIKKPLVSCHEHNESLRAQELVELIKAGKRIAYASDAGMPGISDPGAKLVQACIAHGLPFEILPGASAVLMSAIMSGIPFAQFTFFGFLPRENKPRKAVLAAVERCEHLAILYESPQRLPATLKELCSLLGSDRQAAVLRELTKLHEQAARGTLESLCERFREPPKGECVIALAGKVREQNAPADEASIDDVLLNALKSGASVRDAAAECAQVCGIPKKRAYQRALELSQSE